MVIIDGIAFAVLTWSSTVQVVSGDTETITEEGWRPIRIKLQGLVWGCAWKAKPAPLWPDDIDRDRSLYVHTTFHKEFFNLTAGQIADGIGTYLGMLDLQNNSR